VSVADARLRRKPLLLDPIEIELEVRNTGEREAENISIEFSSETKATWVPNRPSKEGPFAFPH
jgi:hypothetical protein